MKEKIFYTILGVVLLIFSLLVFYNNYELQYQLRRNGTKTQGIVTNIVNQIQNEYLTIQYATPTGNKTFTTSVRTYLEYYVGEHVVINYDKANTNNIELGSPFFKIGHDYTYIIEGSALLLLSTLCFYALGRYPFLRTLQSKVW